MANSGWSWHLFAAPAVWIGRLRGIPTVVNYRGGEAATFLARSGRVVRSTLQRTNALVVPSEFLREIFRRCGFRCEVVPNIVDLDRFRPGGGAADVARPRLVVARNLEPIYDIRTALRAFSLVRDVVPGARLTVAGTGPELAALKALCTKLGIADAVEFCGRLDRDQMAALYRSATVAVNPSRVDNMPNSVLEAMASGVPIVSTDAGGVPYVLRDGATGLLVGAGDHAAMANAVLRIVGDRQLAARLRDAALADAQQYAWPRVRQRWVDIYASVRPGARVLVRPA
jgi:glycosyltransferase involved in cell wall biosynthesis